MTNFITDEDYKVVIGENALRVISQVSADIRADAETEAIEEIAGYLRPKYDVNAVFAVGDGSKASLASRNRLIVMYACDIALYHMSASQPQKMGAEIRKERYERAIKWLESVQAQKVIPDLPIATDENGQPTGFLFKFNSQKKLKHNW